MLDELIRSNAVDKRWAEELIAGAATLTVRLHGGPRLNPALA